jgi:hypothetical protein
VDNDVPEETNYIDALPGICKGPPTNERLDPVSYQKR